MTALPYVPVRGDIVWLDLNPQSGHEQAGRRPCVVVSPERYNGKTGLGLFCPITSHSKGYPFELPLPEGLPVSGVILTDHVKSLDWRARKAEWVCSLPSNLMVHVTARIQPLIG